jgi:hypothetical protein
LARKRAEFDEGEVSTQFHIGAATAERTAGLIDSRRQPRRWNGHFAIVVSWSREGADDIGY